MLKLDKFGQGNDRALVRADESIPIEELNEALELESRLISNEIYAGFKDKRRICLPFLYEG